MTSNDKDLDMWTDTDVYYWVFKIDVGEAHALAMWQEAIDGKILSAMRKRQLHDICKTLSREKTSTLWQEIKKLQKQGRKSSLFGKKGKPTPITPDYPGDDSFDSDSDFDSLEEDEVDVNTEDMNHTSLPDLLKERLKEFKAQQEEMNNDPELYIAPDDNQGPQDEYEEFDGAEVPENNYLAPPNDDDAPPPIPSRVPLNLDSPRLGAPDLPPRPGASPSRSPQRRNPPPPDSEEEVLIFPPEEDYVVPLEQVEDLYLPPKGPEADDYNEMYETPNQNDPPAFVPKMPLPSKFNLLPKPPMPKAPNKPDIITRGTPEIKTQPPLPPSNLDRPTSQTSISQRMKQFEISSGPQPPKPATPQSGLRQIMNQSKQDRPPSSTLNPSFVKNAGRFTPTSPKRTISPRAAPPLPSPTLSRPTPALPNPLPPRHPSLPSNPTPLRQTPTPPPANRPIQPLPRSFTPDLPKPMVPTSSRPVSRVNENSMSGCDWFHETLSRDEATTALQKYREEGTFVVRSSTKNQAFPYTLQLFYKGKIRNLQIGIREDKKYALGAMKEGETRFASVRELIDYHRTHDVVLANSEGRTCLIRPVLIS
ncbi:uncharacterized protein [Apostichopus japonicus]|uniref:uncharacterized protein isoform X2 n=1 Tax=Stichopus japonicus TaxID=307972 RepID=UPI003AB3DA3C